jgi:hypothetical protein
MRASVLMVLLLSVATLAWLTRAGSRPAFAPEPAPLQQHLLPVTQPAQAAVADPQPAMEPAQPAAYESVGGGSASNGKRAFAESDAWIAPAMSEGDLLEDGAWVDVDRTVRLAATHEGFNKLLQMLASSSSVEISQRQASYQNLFMSDPLYLSGDLQVGQVTCGESVCAAFVTGPDTQQLSAFIARLRSSQRPPIYSLTALDVPADASRAGQRLIFSINLGRTSKYSIRRRSR